MATETKTETTSLLVEIDAAPLTSVLPGQVSGGCGIRTREGLHPTRFPSLPFAGHQRSDHTARRRLQACQPVMNPDERSRMRLRLRLALRPTGAIEALETLRIGWSKAPEPKPLACKVTAWPS